MIRSVQVKDAGQIRDLCHQALGYDSTLEKVAAQIDKFNSPDSDHFCFWQDLQLAPSIGDQSHVLEQMEKPLDLKH